MKKETKVAALAVLALLLGGCSAAEAATPVSTPPAPVEAASEPSAAAAERDRDGYLSALRRIDPQFGQLDEEALLIAADGVCQRALIGMGAAGTVGWMDDAGMPREEALAIIAAAAMDYCPGEGR